MIQQPSPLVAAATIVVVSTVVAVDVVIARLNVVLIRNSNSQAKLCVLLHLCFPPVFVVAVVTMAAASTADRTPLFATRPGSPYPSVYEDPEFQQEQRAAALASAARPVADGPVNLSIVSPENCDLLDGVQKLVDELWRKHGPVIAGEQGYKAIRLQAVRDSHPEFPVFASVLGSMPSLANGRIPPCAAHCIATHMSHIPVVWCAS